MEIIDHIPIEELRENGFTVSINSDEELVATKHYGGVRFTYVVYFGVLMAGWITIAKDLDTMQSVNEKIDLFLNNKNMNTQHISNIITSIHGNDVLNKRIAALKNAGYEVNYFDRVWNFGKVGTVKEIDGGVYAQLSCATGGKTRTGYCVNFCQVYKIN